MIDASGEVHAHGSEQGRVQAVFARLFPHGGTQAENGLFRVGQGVCDSVLELDQPAGEIRDGQRERILAYFHADKVSGVRVEAVHARTAPGSGFLLAPVGENARLFHFADDAGDLGDAGAQLAGQIRQAEGIPLLTKGEDAFFLRCIAAFQKRVRE